MSVGWGRGNEKITLSARCALPYTSPDSNVDDDPKSEGSVRQLLAKLLRPQILIGERKGKVATDQVQVTPRRDERSAVQLPGGR